MTTLTSLSAANRQKAVVAKETTYISDRACGKQHIGLRYVNSDMCVACARQREAAKRKANADAKLGNYSRTSSRSAVQNGTIYAYLIHSRAANIHVTSDDLVQLKAKVRKQLADLVSAGDITSAQYIQMYAKAHTVINSISATIQRNARKSKKATTTSQPR